MSLDWHRSLVAFDYKRPTTAVRQDQREDIIRHDPNLDNLAFELCADPPTPRIRILLGLFRGRFKQFLRPYDLYVWASTTCDGERHTKFGNRERMEQKAARAVSVLSCPIDVCLIESVLVL